MEADNLIVKTLQSSSLISELREYEINALADIITVREYNAGDVIVKQDDTDFNGELNDTLLILATGKVEVNNTSNGETTVLADLKPGDLASIIGFVSCDISQISANVIAKTDSKLLVLNRVSFESLLKSQPAIVYYVMRGLASYVHSIVRKLNQDTIVLTNYMYRPQGPY